MDRLHEAPQGSKVWNAVAVVYIHTIYYNMGNFFYNFCDGENQGKVIMKIEFGS